MNKKALYSLWPCFLIMLLLVPSVLQAVETGAKPEPVAVIPETVFEFPDMVEGEYVIHDFVVQNTGTAVLNVKVKTT